MVVDLELPVSRHVQIDVFDLAGHRVRRLVEGQEFEAGTQSFLWDGTDDAAAPVPNGLYLVRARSGTEATARKVAVLR
jgi:flagellar hook assembly protein FlgD